MNLFAKYDVPVPRYTSYPTVPYWEGELQTAAWLETLRATLARAEARSSFYMHIPFCESLCTFCGCNTVITKNHKLENPYITTLLKEMDLYFRDVPELGERAAASLHIGGGTPTFLSATHLQQLLEPFFKKIRKAPDFEASIEVDPRHVHLEQLQVLRDLGFERLSLGVQDFNPEVQRLVNRNQSFAQTEKVLQMGRQLNYRSVNFDLIYGLPAQTLQSLEQTVAQTLQLRPDRIALYSFALVPWIKPQQKLFKDKDLPAGADKRALYEFTRSHLLNNGYVEIGMDHFALKEEALAQAGVQGKLHRNFMGYTDRKSDVLVGWGVSAISESATCYHQNEKVLGRYTERVEKGEIPTHRGHQLTNEDRIQKQRILDLMTKGRVQLSSEERKPYQERLLEMQNDGLLVWNVAGLELTEKGRPFLRNVCAAFDLRLLGARPQGQLFSRSV